MARRPRGRGSHTLERHFALAKFLIEFGGGRMGRTAKENQSYDKEIASQTEKIEKMRADGKDFHDIKQQVQSRPSHIKPNPTIRKPSHGGSGTSPETLSQSQPSHTCCPPPWLSRTDAKTSAHSTRMWILQPATQETQHDGETSTVRACAPLSHAEHGTSPMMQ